jgi:hypothetical protein
MNRVLQGKDLQFKGMFMLSFLKTQNLHNKTRIINSKKAAIIKSLSGLSTTENLSIFFCIKTVTVKF